MEHKITKQSTDVIKCCTV